MTPAQLHTATIASHVSDDSPAIIFLTHGLGSSYKDWSNSLYRDSNGNWVKTSTFVYDSESIIEKIRNTTFGGIKLYVAEMTNPYGQHCFDESKFKLKEYVLDDVEYPNTYLEAENPETSLNDFSQHIVVVLNLVGNYDETNALLYQKLDYMIDKISYDYYIAMYRLPKINLIGHSRGGILTWIMR